MRFFLAVSFILLLLSTNSSFAKSKKADNGLAFFGYVIDDESGEPIVGAKIEIEGRKKNIYTDFDGKFYIPNVSEGVLNIDISYISFKSVHTSLEMAAASNKKRAFTLTSK
ncbi:MAG: carboxypeptidase-like regulatory domain-containing protein [Cyclobacteriaceae bacterium]